MDIDSHFQVPTSFKVTVFTMWLFKTFILALIGAFFIFFAVWVAEAVIYALSNSHGDASFGPIVGWTIFLTAALWLYMAYEQSIKKINRAERDYHEFAKALQQTGLHFDYWYATPRSAIGVDVNGKQLTVATPTRKGRFGQVVTMPFEKITGYRVETPPADLVKVFGFVPFSVQRQNERDNARAVAEAKAATGLLLTFDDLEHSQALLVMPREHANTWFLLIKRACEGNLGSQTESRFYPEWVNNA